MAAAPDVAPEAGPASAEEDLDTPSTGHRSSGSQPRDRSSQPAEAEQGLRGRHVRLSVVPPPTEGEPSRVYYGSYARSARSLDSAHPRARDSVPTTPLSTHHPRLARLLGDDDQQLKTYGVYEQRDGFFDAAFRGRRCHEAQAPRTPALSESGNAKEIGSFSERWRALRAAVGQRRTLRLCLKLFKVFLAFFAGYVVCLIPRSAAWLGPYAYFLPISVIMNHPGRAVGAQLDGAFLVSFGAVVGLLWGGLVMKAASSAFPSQVGSGLVTALFLFLSSLAIGWLRSFFARLYQCVLSAGVAIFYMCLADVVHPLDWTNYDLWERLSLFVIPWTCGQAISLAVCLTVYPFSGNFPLASSFHRAFESILDSLVLPRSNSEPFEAELGLRFVEVSQAVRDYTLDASFTRVAGSDLRTLRNLTQGVIRAVLAIRPEAFFHPLGDLLTQNQSTPSALATPAHILRKSLSQPAQELKNALQCGIKEVDRNLMMLLDQRTLASSTHSGLEQLSEAKARIEAAISQFDVAKHSIFGDGMLLPQRPAHAEIVDLCFNLTSMRQAADSTLSLVRKVQEIQEKRPLRVFRLPTYPLRSALFHANSQVRHDRGGFRAGHYFRSMRQLRTVIEDLQSRPWLPINVDHDVDATKKTPPSDPPHAMSLDKLQSIGSFRYFLWSSLRRLQDYEARFALKLAMLVTLISLPSLVPQSSPWWRDNDCWWTTVTVWIMMNPRFGGNFTDLLLRTSSAVCGSIWAALAFAAGSGSPYVVAVFAAIFMIPMLYRYTISSHPRSGVIGCLSFTFVSLAIYQRDGSPSVAELAWPRGLSITIGCMTAILINWMIWAFVVRHELRKSVSTVILYSAILYRITISKYIYHNIGEAPSSQDIARSEMLEGRVREVFITMRELIDLTQREVRLRAPFDASQYVALIEACERFFDRLIDVRQASLFYKPDVQSESEDSRRALLTLRRDAVASILMNLYTLAGALRSGRCVPYLLPSAAYARKRLVEAMDSAEDQKLLAAAPREGSWEDVYRYAYSATLTDIIDQVQQVETRVKAIVGEGLLQGMEEAS